MRRAGLLALALASTSAVHATPRLIGVTSFPRVGPQALAVGGLSGVDFDPRTGEWILISDDRSQHGPARLWRAAIDYGLDRLPIARLIAPVILRDAQGSAYPAPGSGAEALDGEAIRIAPSGHGLLWSSEGDQKDSLGPAVRLSDRDGRLIRTLALPPIFAFDPTGRTGPRGNLTIEGLSYSSGGRHLWLGMEAPLAQDGPLATREAGADVRLSRIDPASGHLQRQYAYRVEAIGPVPTGRLADNGVSEILTVDDRHLLLLERSGRQQADGDFRFVARLWCASVTGASDVASLPSLSGRPYRVMSKKLVFDFSTAPQRIDNIEGMTWGHPLENGNASLVLVTDNDFSPQRDNQVIALDTGTPRNDAARALCPR